VEQIAPGITLVYEKQRRTLCSKRVGFTPQVRWAWMRCGSCISSTPGFKSLLSAGCGFAGHFAGFRRDHIDTQFQAETT
jgi:hypothetical protein